MVPNPRAPLGARTLRPLNGPTPIAVRADPEGRPLAVRRRSWSAPRAVTRVQDRWRIDDEWWRERPISRLYHALVLDDGTLITVYRDLDLDAWFEQRENSSIRPPRHVPAS